MRALPALAFALLAASVLAAPATAQSPASAGTLTAEYAHATTGRLLPGESAGLVIAAVRSCSSQAQILPAGVLQVHPVASSDLVAVTGPNGVAMEQLVCAEQPRQEFLIRMNATARSDLGANFTTTDATIVFQLHTDAGSLGSPAPPAAVISTLFVIVAPEHDASAVWDASAPERPAPAGGVLVAVGALALVAWVARRR